MSYQQTSVLSYKGRSIKIYWKFQKKYKSEIIRNLRVFSL